MGRGAIKKTEHCGGKNGGGSYGKCIAVKCDSRVVRRQNDKKAIKQGLEENEISN